MSRTPLMKDGRFYSKTMLAFAAGQPCMVEGCPEAVQVHHWPPKGMGGARRRDDRVIPLCRQHHEDAQQYRIPREVQDRWVDQIRSRFMEQANNADWASFTADREAWRASRIFAEAVPW